MIANSKAFSGTLAKNLNISIATIRLKLSGIAEVSYILPEEILTVF